MTILKAPHVQSFADVQLDFEAVDKQFPITTANITDGTITNADLSSATLNTWLKLATAADVHIAYGTTSVSWSASTDSTSATVTHGLGVTPVAVLVTPQTASAFAGIPAMQASSIGATTFSTQGRVAAAITQTITVSWVAIG